jgi:hypothetical protein
MSGMFVSTMLLKNVRNNLPSARRSLMGAPKHQESCRRPALHLCGLADAGSPTDLFRVETMLESM